MAKVLLIEDSPWHLNNWKDTLIAKGHQIFTAQDGLEGLEALTNNPDIIFCDHEMPKMNGYEFCRLIKTDPKYEQYSNIPIVSVGSFPEDKREYLARFLQKPIMDGELFDTINDFVK